MYRNKGGDVVDAEVTVWKVRLMRRISGGRTTESHRARPTCIGGCAGKVIALIPVLQLTNSLPPGRHSRNYPGRLDRTTKCQKIASKGDNLTAFWHRNGYSALTPSFSDGYRPYSPNN